MECKIDPKLPYTDLSSMIRQQRKVSHWTYFLYDEKNSLGLELLSLFNSSFVLDPEMILKQKKYKLYDSIIESSSPLPRKN